MKHNLKVDWATHKAAKKILPLSQPYPKRVKQAIADEDQSTAEVQHLPTRSKSMKGPKW